MRYVDWRGLAASIASEVLRAVRDLDLWWTLRILALLLSLGVWGTSERLVHRGPVEVTGCHLSGDPRAASVASVVVRRNELWPLLNEVQVQIRIASDTTRTAEPVTRHAEVVPAIEIPLEVHLPPIEYAEARSVSVACHVIGPQNRRLASRIVRPFFEWPTNRRIVFISGMGTSSASTAGTFDVLARSLRDALGVKNADAFAYFSYSGSYHITGALRVTTDPGGRQYQVAAYLAPAFTSDHVCSGAVSAAAKLRKLVLDHPPHYTFDLVGHSYGGFVAAYFLASLGTDAESEEVRRRIHSVVTLDSPLQGLIRTERIAGLVSSCGDEFLADVAPDSAAVSLIQALQPGARAAPYFVSVGNIFDGFVGNDIAYISGLEHHPLDVRCAKLASLDFGHGCVLDDPAGQVQEILVDVIQGVGPRTTTRRGT